MEQVLNSCCGFLHDMNPETEKGLIDRFLGSDAAGRELSGMKRRAFLVTSVPVKGSVEFLPGRFIQTLTGWDPETAKEKGSMPDGSHHVHNYSTFRTELVLGKTVHNIIGFDGAIEDREEDFIKKDSMHPELPHMCILSNQQHNAGEPFLLKHGYSVACRGRNQFWYDNHLTVFVKPATKTAETPGTDEASEGASVAAA